MIPKRAGLLYPPSAAPMIKSLAAFAVFAALGASVMALPSFAPMVQASEVVALPRADRLEIRAVSRNCSKQVWPDFATACLRTSNSEAKIVEARLVTARR
jgi:hypothetical protein